MGKRNPLTSSERRGAFMVAIVALLITGLGVGLSYILRPSESYQDAEVEIIMKGDSINNNEKSRKLKKASSKTKKRGKRTTKKMYKKRNPIDEEVRIFDI